MPIINHEYNPRSGENVYALAEGGEESALAVEPNERTRTAHLPSLRVSCAYWRSNSSTTTLGLGSSILDCD